MQRAAKEVSTGLVAIMEKASVGQWSLYKEAHSGTLLDSACTRDVASSWVQDTEIAEASFTTNKFCVILCWGDTMSFLSFFFVRLEHAAKRYRFACRRLTLACFCHVNVCAVVFRGPNTPVKECYPGIGGMCSGTQSLNRLPVGLSLVPNQEQPILIASILPVMLLLKVAVNCECGFE